MSQRDRWKDVRNLEGKLLCRINPRDGFLEVSQKGRTERIDLKQFGMQPSPEVDDAPGNGYND